MGMAAEHDGAREELNLRSQRGAFPRAPRPEAMPQMVYEEFREAVDGMTIHLNREDSLRIEPRVTSSNLVRVIFATEVNEGERNHTVGLKIIAADESRPGVSFRMDPDEICLIQKFGAAGEHNVRIDAKWNSQLGFLEFGQLKFGAQYVLVFTSAGAGDFSEMTLPAVPGHSASRAD